MVNIQPVDTANYSAVKVRVNDAKAINFNENLQKDSGAYNAADIEVNRPVVFTYPDAKSLVTYKMAQIAPVNVPKSLPVPEPNVTTTEAEKELAFHGVNFKATPKKPEIIPPQEIKPDVDVQAIEDNLTSDDYDVQAKQLHDILKGAAVEKNAARDYIVPEIFISLDNIINKDVSNLAKPTEAQKEARNKIRENIMAADKAFADGVKPEDFKMPYEMSDDEVKLALTLTPFEQAERNKTYALVVSAVLSKAYADGVEEQTGNVVPLTDLPGVSTMVDVLRKEKNSEVKLAALDSLRYISRPEYKEELVTIFTLAAQSSEPKVAQVAAIMAMMLEGISPEDFAQAA